MSENPKQKSKFKTVLKFSILFFVLCLLGFSYLYYLSQKAIQLPQTIQNAEIPDTIKINSVYSYDNHTTTHTLYYKEPDQIRANSKYGNYMNISIIYDQKQISYINHQSQLVTILHNAHQDFQNRIEGLVNLNSREGIKNYLIEEGYAILKPGPIIKQNNKIKRTYYSDFAKDLDLSESIEYYLSELFSHSPEYTIRLIYDDETHYLEYIDSPYDYERINYEQFEYNLEFDPEIFQPSLAQDYEIKQYTEDDLIVKFEIKPGIGIGDLEIGADFTIAFEEFGRPSYISTFGDERTSYTLPQEMEKFKKIYEDRNSVLPVFVFMYRELGIVLRFNNGKVASIDVSRYTDPFYKIPSLLSYPGKIENKIGFGEDYEKASKYFGERLKFYGEESGIKYYYLDDKMTLGFDENQTLDSIYFEIY